MAIDAKISHIKRDIIMDKGEKQPGIAVEKEVGNAINQLIMNTKETSRLAEEGKKKRPYVTAQTECIAVELESGFMGASVFDPEEQHDKGVTTTGHEFGNSGNYFDNADDTKNTWDRGF